MVKVRLPELRRAREDLRRRAEELKRARDELRRFREDIRSRVKIREELTSFRKEFQKDIVAFLTGAFAFVAALTWNDLIRETISRVVSPSEELFYKYIAALIVTVIAIVIIYILSKFKSKE
ncbi:MAG: hypothetical protein HYT70_01660 [Candidatus Aenigmarchaeota archaeon]|nr:hypothetical protein [Candidatus Aenigmarchaeota archaeon]